MTIIMQITLASITGAAAILAASMLPLRRPLTDDTRHRFVLSMALTMMVMCCPACQADVAYSLFMFLVGSCATMGMLQFVLGDTPYRRVSPVLIEARQPRGYSWVAAFMVRRVEVMA